MRMLFILLFLIAIGPLWVLVFGEADFQTDWRTANRDSAHIAPDPKTTKEAVIQVYSARAYHWRGLFSVHTWIAVKATNAKHYTVYQVIGWRLYQHLPALMAEQDIPDRYWFNHKPEIIFDLRGPKADDFIGKIAKLVAAYPYSKYHAWPGPNSNTLPAYIARHLPDLRLSLPSNAIGKDFLPPYTFFASAPSGTGYQLSIFGLIGILLAKDEGLEVNILGLVYGISPTQGVIKLPGIGPIKFIN